MDTKKKKVIICACVAIVIIIAVVIAIAYPISQKNKTYKLAISYMEGGDFPKARLEFWKIPGYKDTESILENYNINHRKYLEQQAAKSLIPEDQLNDETYTAAVQVVLDTLPGVIDLLNTDTSNLYPNKERAAASEIINEYIWKTNLLDTAIISLMTLGDHPSVKTVKDEGIQALFELENVCWRIIEEVNGYEYIKRGIYEDIVKDAFQASSAISDIEQWLPLLVQ